jgi:lysophospholipase L1-like esterase
MSIKETKAFPETGWECLCTFLGFNSCCCKQGQNGRSPNLISEGLWRSIADEMKDGDMFLSSLAYDEAKDKGERYATPDTFRMNLTRFVADTRAKGAIPILMTPVSRRRFDTAGIALETHKEYAAYVKEVAAKENVLLIDLDTRSRELYQQFGKGDSKLLFLQLKPGEHPNYPDGRDDNTHFNELGARLIAQLVLQELRGLNIELTQRVIIPPVKK